MVIVQKGREAELETIFKKWDLHAAHIGEVTEGHDMLVTHHGIPVVHIPAKALADEARLRTERIVAPTALGPGNPLLGELNDLPDALPQVEADAREATQIVRELEQFETFDAKVAASHYDIPVELNEQVSEYIRMFQGPLRSHFELWLSRSGRYIPSMREILARDGVPEDTVFLSLIESGYNTLAYSVARAAGQWQFIASTGRRFGLRSDFWVDERRDPEKATAAANACWPSPTIATTAIAA